MSHKRYWISISLVFFIAIVAAVHLPAIADSFDPSPNDPPRRTGGSGTR
ncbi:MAG: hypothetical protein KME18_16735 [Phormidium tanganyikae FI6-MK23]|jgi:hypothetical protein|nr:hypothetical protein [Phormidium tanganyikae FI6-MK23]